MIYQRFIFFISVVFLATIHAVPVKKNILKKNTNKKSQFYSGFSKVLSKYFESDNLPDSRDSSQMVLWTVNKTSPFDELILSWNSLRPVKGHMAIFIAVKRKGQWLPWHKLADWGHNFQKTFLNSKHRLVHTKHVRVEMQRGAKADGFRVKVVFHKGANPNKLKALFANISDMRKFKTIKPRASLPSVVVSGVPCQSQMRLKHPRYRDLCSPTSVSMMVNYFNKRIYGKLNKPLHDYAVDLANKVYDQGTLDIYGNWILNLAQAFHNSKGNVFYRVQRLNSFYDLHRMLVKKIPIAVSVRKLPGGATPYQHGHLMVIVGWDSKKKHVLCVDPAFGKSTLTRKSYPLNRFLAAWGRSKNLSYIPLYKG